MNLEQIRAIFSDAIMTSPWWQRFKGSEFVTYLLVFVSKVVERVQFAAERRLQESFLSLALNETSVLAHSESRGYVPRRRVPNKKQLLLKNKTSELISIPADTRWYCPDNGLYYLTRQPITIAPSGSASVECIQGELSVIRYDLSRSIPYASVLLDAELSDRVSSIRVFVKEPMAERQLWQRSQLFRRANASTLAYMEYYTPSEQLGIRFGNGIAGKVPAAGSEVYLECLLTEGAVDVAAGLSLMVPTWPELSAKVDVVTGETIDFGYEREGVEQIRHNALYYQNFDEQVVWNSDHRYFIRRNVPGLNFISVWGEAEQEKLSGFQSVEHINRIYICGHHPDKAEPDLQRLIQTLYTTVDGYNEHYIWVTPSHRAYTLRITGTTLSTNDPETVVESLKSALFPLSRQSSELITANPNEIWQIIQKTGLLTKFQLDISADLMTPPAPNEFRYLAIDQSIFDIVR